MTKQVDKKRKKSKYLTQQEIFEVLKEYKSGKSVYVLSNKYDVSIATICLWLKKVGIEARGNRQIDWEKLKNDYELE